VLIAHLSDLHLRDGDDALWLDRQLDRVAARSPDHLAITGDVLDRWSPALLDRVLDALDARALLDPERLTILHGNHDLASSGGHPRRGSDVWRLALRFWDPPPLITWRRRRFYEALRRRAPGIGAPAPFVKTLKSGGRIAVLDSVPLHWAPVKYDGGMLVVKHALGCLRAAEMTWLADQRNAASPLVTLMHHYPLETPSFQWAPPPGSRLRVRGVQVPMHVPRAHRTRLWEAAAAAGVRLLLCGHVHRARLDRHDGIAIGLNGQSGAPWAGHTIAWYHVDDYHVTAETETVTTTL
jgi:hypothetical protein